MSLQKFVLFFMFLIIFALTVDARPNDDSPAKQAYSEDVKEDVEQNEDEFQERWWWPFRTTPKPATTTRKPVITTTRKPATTTRKPVITTRRPIAVGTTRRPRAVGTTRRPRVLTIDEQWEKINPIAWTYNGVPVRG